MKGMKHRIVTVPQIGDDKYRVEGLNIKMTDTNLTKSWRVLDSFGSFWVNWGFMGGVSLPQLELFVSEKAARKWIKDYREYLNKESKVVYESE